jgi:ABC-type phosphate transport system substrate-binding protein
MKRGTIRILLITMLALLFAASAYAADVVVIVNKGNTNDVNRTMIEKIYNGDMAAWPAGGAVSALDLPEDSAQRADFTSAVLGKTVAKAKAQWAAKLFSGRATPPKVLGSDDDVRRAVANNKNAIGYIKSSSLDDSVKSVYTLR